MQVKVFGRLGEVLDVKREELPRSLLMFGTFFLVITTFWILKPLKKSLFLALYDQGGLDLFGAHLGAAEAELLAKELNIAVAFVATAAFTALSSRLRRERLSAAIAAFFVAATLLYAGALEHQGKATVWSFYLFGDLFSTLMVAAFFAFLNDVVDADAAKRTYGLVGLGGVLGGVFGTMVLAGFIDHLEPSGWLLVCALLSAVVLGLVLAAGRLFPARQGSKPSARDDVDEGGRNPATEGARLVFRSRYLLAVLGIVGLYEVVSTVMDFQFSWAVTHFLDGEASIRRHLAHIFLVTNVVSMLVQLFVTSPVMKRLGVTAALLVPPLSAGLGSMAFALVPGLWVGSLLNTADNAFSYSIQQSAKESLYVPRSEAEKYKGKAFIDMFGQRFAKGVGVMLSLGVTQAFTDLDAVRWLSLFTASLVALWVALARYAGHHFDALAATSAPNLGVATPDGAS
jgi:AAA family ATP:ADP antiporter